MMREIKFRAWDIKYKEMMYDIQNRQSFTEYHYKEGGGYLGFHNMLNNQNFNVMQYTGLKDKTGKEIYEGDILQCKCGMWRFDGKQTDKISIKNYEVKWEQINGRWNLYKNGKFELLQPFNKEHLVTWYTVIGNIHENPELKVP